MPWEKITAEFAGSHNGLSISRTLYDGEPTCASGKIMAGYHAVSISGCGIPSTTMTVYGDGYFAGKEDDTHDYLHK